MRLYWLIPALLIILAVIIWTLPTGNFTETLPVVVTISDPGQIGVYTTREPQKLFNFGSTFPGTKVQKTMNLTNGNEPPARARITVSGAILNWTSVNNNDFILDGSAQIEVTVTIPDNAEKGTYNGNITIEYISTYGIRTMQALKQFLK